MRVDPAVSATRRAVRTALTEHAPAGTVLIACSGGADSLALLAAAAHVGHKSNRAIRAITVDHQLQARSRTQAERVASQAEALGVACDIAQVVVRDKGGPEAAARAARYAALTKAAEEHGATAVLLGHTRDDQAETVLLGLARGSGARSLAGMAAMTGIYVRPFLHIDRETTEKACAAQGVQPWNDPHNTDSAYTRVRIRTDVLPALTAALGAGVPEALARTADLLRADADALDMWATEVLRTATNPAGLDVAALTAVPRAVRTRVLKIALTNAGVPAGALAARHIDAAETLVSAWKGQGPLSMPGAFVIERRYGTLRISPAPGTEENPAP